MEICSYINWCVCLFFISYIMAIFSQKCVCGDYYKPLSYLVISVSTTVLVVSDITWTKWLVKEPVTQNPLKLIYQVLRYAAKNKYPRMRSAFTYWEDKPYSRIDLGKSKYGGPFTTEQVEDVKTFFQILVMLIVVVVPMAFVYRESIIPTSRLQHYQGSWFIKANKINKSYFLPCFTNCIHLQFVKNISSFFSIIVLVVLGLLQYVLPVRHFDRIGSMARVVISMVFLILCTLTKLAIEIIGNFKSSPNRNYTCSLYPLPEDHNRDDQVFPMRFYWLILPQAFYCVSQYFMSTSGPRFLVSQSPYIMRGLLFGLTCSGFGASSALSQVILRLIVHFQKDIQKEMKCGLWYSIACVLFSILLLCLFLIIKKFYRPRRRDEDLHNQQIFAEDYYEKYLPTLS